MPGLQMYTQGYDDGNTAEGNTDDKSFIPDNDREKIEDYLRFLTHAGEMRFPIFACKSLSKLSHFVNIMSLILTLTLKISDNFGSNETMQKVLASIV